MGTGLNFRNHAPPESASRWRKFKPVPIFYVTVIPNRSTKCCALSLLAVCLALAQGSRLQQAEQLFQRTDYPGAIALLQADGSREAAVLALAGKSYFLAGDYKNASEMLEKAVELAPSNSGYHHWLGKAYGRRAETSSFLTAPRWASKCRQSFEKAVELDGKNIEAMSDLMEYYLEAPGILGGGQDKAAAMAERIGALDEVEKHYAQARLAEKRKQYVEAEKHLRKAMELAPGELGRVLDLAKFLARRGRVQESDQMFERASKLAPDHPKLLYARAEVYVEDKRNLAEARRLLERYIKAQLTPDDPPRHEAVKLLEKAKG
jgi:Flp pilus assembly protein TadD